MFGNSLGFGFNHVSFVDRASVFVETSLSFSGADLG